MDDMQRLISVLEDVNEDIDYTGEIRLVDDGLIDSLDITVIISGIAQVFGVRITTKDIEPENFNSVKSILELIDRYRAEK